MKTFLLQNLEGLKKLRFRELLRLIIAVFTVQFVLLLLRIPVYLSLVACVLIFLYKKNINEKFLIREEYKPIYLNLSVFATILVLNIVSNNFIVIILDIVYLSFYTILVSRELKKQKHTTFYTNSKNFINICNYFSVFGIIILLIALYESLVSKILGFNMYFILEGIMILCIAFAVIFLKTFKSEMIDEENRETQVDKQLLDGYKLNYKNHYAETDSPVARDIIHFYNNTDLYLNADFNLFDLSRELGYSRGELSEAFNRDMKSGFYSFTGLYRIEHAKKKLLMQENFTIEALMQECGFHSKSTFNKYFKEYVGLKPSVYRKLHADKITL